MADSNQPEATAFFRSLGFFTFKPPDLRFEKQGKVTTQGAGGKAVYPQEKGRFDMFLIGANQSGGVVEVKSGEATRFPFAKVREEQREWYHRVAVPKRISAWIFFDCGELARPDWRDVWQEIAKERRSVLTKSKRKMPRLTVLMSFGKYLELEASGDKSLSYEQVVGLGNYILNPIKGGLALPLTHPFHTAYGNMFLEMAS